MDDEKTKNEQEHPSNEPQYFWGFGGLDFIKRPNSEVYEPIRYRPNNERSPDPQAPVIRIKRDFLEWASIVAGWAISLGTLLVLALYTYYTRGQWHELIRATNAATEASRTAACALAENERQFGIMLGEIKSQTSAQTTSGNAAKKAAKIAQDTLHISERAYVTIGPPQVDTVKTIISIPINNSGHIPAGNTDADLYEATFNPPQIEVAPVSFSFIVERHRSKIYTPSVAPGSPISIAIPTPSISLDLLNKGSQTIMILGTISYNDGFPGTPIQHSPVCIKTIFQTIAKQFFWAPCDAGIELPKFETLDWTSLTTTYR